ncbi:MAG: hypothetical protein JOZ10_02140 [Acidobacteria bacterium]|nr:hypothetical protein [Acidobacteriota bacterium]
MNKNSKEKQTVSSNTQVVVKYSDHRGQRQKRIALSSLAAFILNSVNQPPVRPMVEEAKDNK